MNTHSLNSPAQKVLAAASAVALLFSGAATAFADGTETLGTPGIPIATGSGVVAAGVGLATGQPGVINLNVPSGTIKQVLLYWEGVGTPYQPLFGDDTVVLNGSIVATGDFIGGNEDSFGNAPLDGAFRADITSLGLITSGPNALSVGGLDFDSANGGYVNGAGLLVIFDNGTAAKIDLRDGKDFAYIFRAPPYNATVRQDFTFPASTQARVSQLSMLFASETFAGQGQRPSSIEVVVGNVTNIISNPLNNLDGAEWDTVVFDIDIPAGVTNLSVQGFSRDDSMTPGSNPASIIWTAASLVVPLPSQKGPGTGTLGYWKNHPSAWCSDSIVVGGKTYTKAQAIALLKTAGKGDKTIDQFHQLVPAKLNVCAGNEAACVSAAIASADAFLQLFPVGSKVKASSSAWKTIEATFTTLGAYNEGQLCAPHRD